MFNVSDIEYHSNPEKRKVVAIIRGIEFDAAEDLITKTNSDKLLMPGVKYITMPSTMVATAYCHPHDDFDEEVGRKIARKRLIKMYNNTKASTINRFLIRIQRFYESGNKVRDQIRDRARIDVYSDL